jgi:hypothetical protein
MSTIQDNFDNTAIFGSGAEPKQGVYEVSATQEHKLGAVYEKADGRTFRYARAGATQLAKNLVNAAAAQDAQAITSTIQTGHGAGVGEVTFTVLQTTGNAWVDGSLIDGWLHVSDGGAAMGDLYEIKSNVWITGDTVMSVTLSDPHGLVRAIAATDDVILYANQMALTVVSATTTVSDVAGVALTIVPVNNYYWAQYRGLASILVDGTDTIVVGDVAVLSDSVAGTIHLNDALADDVPVGICVAVGAVGEASLINMNLS